jgi:curli biogenesis system outer membrane secretion channel CsgG
LPFIKTSFTNFRPIILAEIAAVLKDPEIPISVSQFDIRDETVQSMSSLSEEIDDRPPLRPGVHRAAF